MKSDLNIKQDIIDEFTYDPAVNPTDIGIVVHSGIVTLTGKVTTLAEKIAARDAARRISGVKAVAIDIDVLLGKDHVRDDTEIAKAVERMLVWSTTVPSDRLQVVVEDGKVTLTGDVDWSFQRKAAIKSVSHLMGVRGVYNQIIVKPRVSPQNVSTEIEAALKRQVEREAHRIDIAVDGGVVTLRGKVRTESERRAAIGAAFNAIGVSDVVDELQVAQGEPT